LKHQNVLAMQIDAFREARCAVRTILIRREGDRLYNTESETNVSLSDLADILVNGLRITVEDAATGADITSEILDMLSASARSRGLATQSES
jgi:polyhydroxyalkanoate synthesis regulator protein